MVISAPSVKNICELFTHNLLTRAQGNPKFISLMGIHNECIANASKLKYYFRVGQYECMCVTIGNKKYTLKSHTKFVPPRKRGQSPAYPPKPTHGNIAVGDRHYKKSVYNHHLVKNMNRSLSKIVSADICNQQIKGAKHTVMRYNKKFFMELMD